MSNCPNYLQDEIIECYCQQGGKLKEKCFTCFWLRLRNIASKNSNKTKGDSNE